MNLGEIGIFLKTITRIWMRSSLHAKRSMLPTLGQSASNCEDWNDAFNATSEFMLSVLFLVIRGFSNLVRVYMITSKTTHGGWFVG